MSWYLEKLSENDPLLEIQQFDEKLFTKAIVDGINHVITILITTLSIYFRILTAV
jgi:hypothetical protein